MCEDLSRMIGEDLRPYLQAVRDEYAREADENRVGEIEDLLQTLTEIADDIESGVMDEWECGELYEEFKRARESGQLLDKMS